jgi:predicted RNA binding protein YcfA (HicA-like mRNA interferase family)
MARLRKLLPKARNNPRGIRFEELLVLVEVLGFEPIPQRGGSHRRFVHPAAGV